MKGAIQMSNLENYMKQQAIFCEQNDSISKNLYSEYGVKRGLRDEKGQGVLTGLTNISDIKAFEYRDGVKSPCDGELSYRGYNIKDLVTGSKGKRFVFEEGAYLLLFGELPTDTQLSPNIDFYSGFVYDMLNIPRELYTPLFAIARIAGWSAHRLEELITTDKIIRPAYKSLVSKKEYIEREER